MKGVCPRHTRCPLPAARFQVFVVFVGPSFPMSSSMMEQFGAATAHVAQQVEALVQRLSLCRRAFREGLAEAAALNDAQIGLYRMDVGGAPFHTRTEALHRYGGMLSAMASDDFSHDVDVGGQTFLDRDPRWFPLVMHFLRTGDALLPEDTEGRGAVFREAQYYSLEGLCQAARPVQEQIIIIGDSWSSADYACQQYKPLQGSWARLDVDMSALPNDCCWCAGDGCLFAVKTSDAQREGSVLRFCPAARSWECITSSNPILNFFSSWAYHGGHLYGTDGTCVQSLDVATGQWEALPPLSTWRVASLCVVDGRLFVIGGLINSDLVEQSTASVEEYVALERRWVSVPDMPIAVWGAAAVALDGKLLIIGGTDSSNINVISAVLEYNPEDRSWNGLPSLLTARSKCTATVLGGDVVVMGGCYFDDDDDAFHPLSSVERYNRRLQCWEAMPSLTDTLQDFAAVVIQA